MIIGSFTEMNCVIFLLRHWSLSSSSQQLLREMQQMASRPFATINVALETDEEPPDLIGGNVKVSVTSDCDINCPVSQSPSP